MLHGKQLATGSTPTNRLNLGGTEGQMVNFDESQLLSSTSLINASPTSLTIDGDMVVSNADVDVNGNVVQLNTETISFGDTVVEINTGGAAGNIGFSINRGSDLDTSFYYDQGSDVWKMDTLVDGAAVTKSVLLEDVMTAADEVLSDAVSAEGTRSSDARVVIGEALSTAISARVDGDAAISSSAAAQLITINGWIGDSNSDIDGETTRASNMESDILAKLEEQISNAGTAESNLTGLVNAQISEAQDEETALRASLTGATLDAITAENALSGSTIAQRGAAEDAESTLDGLVDDESARQQIKDGTFHGDVHTSLVNYLNEEIRHQGLMDTLEDNITTKVESLRGNQPFKSWTFMSGFEEATNQWYNTNNSTFSEQMVRDWVDLSNLDEHATITARHSHEVPAGESITTGTYTFDIDDDRWDFNSEPKVKFNGIDIDDSTYTWTWIGSTYATYPRPGMFGHTRAMEVRPELKTIEIDIASLGFSVDPADIITVTYNITTNNMLNFGMQAGEHGCTDTSYIGADINAEHNTPALCVDQVIFNDLSALALTITNDYHSYGEQYCIIGLEIKNQATNDVVLSKAFADLAGGNEVGESFSLAGLVNGVYTLTVTHGSSTVQSMGAATTMILSDQLYTFGGETATYTAAYPLVVSGTKTIIPFTINNTTIAGCTNPDACNFDANANFDNGSCEMPEEGFDCEGNSLVGSCEDEAACNFGEEGECTYAEENYDCDGNCIVGEDCEGTCGGELEYDCEGTCGGTAQQDECGDCYTDGEENENWNSCQNVEHESAVEDISSEADDIENSITDDLEDQYVIGEASCEDLTNAASTDYATISEANTTLMATAVAMKTAFENEEYTHDASGNDAETVIAELSAVITKLNSNIVSYQAWADSATVWMNENCVETPYTTIPMIIEELHTATGITFGFNSAGDYIVQNVEYATFSTLSYDGAINAYNSIWFMAGGGSMDDPSTGLDLPEPINGQTFFADVFGTLAAMGLTAEMWGAYWTQVGTLLVNTGASAEQVTAMMAFVTDNDTGINTSGLYSVIAPFDQLQG